MTKILGLDIGIASIGWAVVDQEKETIRDGVFLFDKAETPKEGKSLNLARSSARSHRKTLSRKVHRLKKLKNILMQNNICRSSEIIESPWKLRKDGLYRKLDTSELFVVIYHIAKRRGYHSNRISDFENEDGKVKEGIKNNKNAFKSANSLTIGEFLYDKYNGTHIRNKRDTYYRTITRDLLRAEVTVLFEKQRGYGHVLSADFERKITGIMFDQKPTGSVKEMVGPCTFESDEKRAPKNCYHIERYVAWQRLNQIKIQSDLGETKQITLEDKKSLITKIHTQTKFTFKQLRTYLKLNENYKFNLVNYNVKSKTKADPESKTFIELKGYHDLRKCLEKKCSKEDWIKLEEDKQTIDKIVEIFAYFKDDKLIRSKLEKLDGVPSKWVDPMLENINFSKMAHISLKAAKRILPEMEKGDPVHIATEKVGYSIKQLFQGHSKCLPLPTKEDLYVLTNPVVKRAFYRTRKIINAIIQKSEFDSTYKFEKIHIELARNIKKSLAERKKDENINNENQENNRKAESFCKEMDLPINGKNITKVKLFNEQTEICPYSMEPLTIDELKDETALEIEHIIPRSISFNNSFTNLLLVKSKSNREKSNQLAGEYLKKIGQYDQSIAFCEKTAMSKPKLTLLKKTILSDSEKESFNERNLTDTRYLSVFIKDFIQKHLKFDSSTENKQYVFTRSGKITSMLRQMWGISKDRSKDDKHHAIDAIILACSTNYMVQQLSTYMAKLETTTSNKKQPGFRWPWKTFRDDLNQSLSDIKCVRTPQKKISGLLHKQTLYSKKYLDKKRTKVNCPLTHLDEKKLEKIVDKENGNKKLYTSLKHHFEKNGSKKGYSFSNTNRFFIIQKNGEKRPIYKIKIWDDKKVCSGGVELHGGIYEREQINRVDVYLKNNKYFLVPIYISDFATGNCPNKAISSGKGAIIEIDQNYQFQFSLHKYDIIKIQTKKKGPIIDYYFSSVHSRSGSLIIKNINGEPFRISNDGKKPEFESSIGVKNVTIFKKCCIDLFGEIREVHNHSFLPLKK